MSAYEQALADWTYLWEEYAPARDMTGGYVDQNDLRRLLLTPTKAMAAKCLTNQIEYWFQVGTEECDRQPDPDDPRLQEIADRYGEYIR